MCKNAQMKMLHTMHAMLCYVHLLLHNLPCRVEKPTLPDMLDLWWLMSTEL